MPSRRHIQYLMMFYDVMVIYSCYFYFAFGYLSIDICGFICSIEGVIILVIVDTFDNCCLMGGTPL